MAPPCNRSLSLEQAATRSDSVLLARSNSYYETCPRSHNSSLPVVFDGKQMPNSDLIKECLVDAETQLNEFSKNYLKCCDLGDTKIIPSLTDAKKRLPYLAKQLQCCSLEKLPLVKKTSENIAGNLVKTLLPNEHSAKDMETYIERAAHATGNAILLCPKQAVASVITDKTEDLVVSNDIMSAALIMRQYFVDLINKTL